VGVNAQVRLQGLPTRDDKAPDGLLRDLTGKLILRHQQEGEGIPFSLDNGYATNNPDNFLVWLNNMPSTGVSFNLSGLGARGDTANVPDPLRLDWYLYPSGDCIIDAEPVWEGSTWLTVGGTKRTGRLVQVTNLDARAWFLKVVIENPGAGVSLTGSLEYFCPVSPLTGALHIVTGPAVG
jgi:hypothetical protein